RGVDAELGEVDPVRALSTHRRGEERLRDSPTAPCPYGPEQVDVARGVPRDLPVVLVLLDPDVTRDASRALLARDEAPPGCEHRPARAPVLDRARLRAPVVGEGLVVREAHVLVVVGPRLDAQLPRPARGGDGVVEAATQL